MKTSRRKFITRSVLATAGISTGFSSVINAGAVSVNTPAPAAALQAKDKDAFSISIFSKHLQWLGYSDMAKVASEIGFDGVDLTVSPGGYVEPEKVEEDLQKAMAALNEKNSISGEYQNHLGYYGDGVYFGAPIWDIATALKGINSKWLGSQYDVYHATIEGANAWQVGFRLISPYIRSIDIKDFKWYHRYLKELEAGYSPQYVRNMLQLNNGEVGGHGLI